MRRRMLPVVILALGSGLMLFRGFPTRSIGAEEREGKADRSAVERAREQVHMLDDLYKNFVVQITATYVDASEKTPAAQVAMKVFKAMHQKGYHKARLVDASGDPIRKANLPKTTFEKKAVEQLKKGKSYYEEIGTESGKPMLRAATVVPVVMKQCLACHTGKKEGELIGALVYEVPIK